MDLPGRRGILPGARPLIRAEDLLPMHPGAFRLKAVLWFLCGAAVLFGGQLLVDVWLGAASWSADIATPERANMLVTGLSRSSNQLVALILTSIALAIPLTANMYTPKLIEMFISHPLNQVILPLFVFTMAQANFALYTVGGGAVPRLQIVVLLASQLTCYVVLVPYFYFVIRFIDPEQIVARVTQRALATLERIASGRLVGVAAKDRLVEGLYDLTHIALRAIERGDRDVAAAGLWAIRRVARRYAAVKPGLGADWFVVEKKFFAGLSAEALALLARDRVWVEQKYLSDLGAAFLPALTKMPDIVSAISDITRLIAHDAREAGDPGLLEHAIRHLNTLLREAIKARNVHATFDIFQNYKRLAIELIGDDPAELKRIGFYFRYYSQAALAAGTPFVLELAAYDLGEVTRIAFERHAPGGASLLEDFLSIRPEAGRAPSARLIKARVLLAAYLWRASHTAEVDRIVAETAPVPEETLAEVERDLLETSEPYFWEITDRQVNLDYTPPADRDSVRAVLARLGTCPPPPA